MREQRSQELWQQIGEVWHLSLPAILTQITTIAMQYIDSAMVGALGANASAAIGLVATTTWLFGGITYAIAAGFSVQVAHHIGGKKEKEARQVVCHGLLVALLVSGILCLIGLSISGRLRCGWAVIRRSEDASAYFMVYALMVPFHRSIP